MIYFISFTSAILALVNTIFTLIKVSSRTKLWVSISASVITFTIAAIGTMYQYKQDQINAKTGRIISSKGSGDRMVFEISNDGTGSKFIFGGGEGVFTMTEGIFSFNNLRYNTVNGRINVNVVIVDSTGKAIASIHDNEWTMDSDDYEYQNNKNSFEIVTKSYRRVLFQIQLLKDEIRIQGLLRDDNGWFFYFKKSHDAPGSGLSVNTPLKNEEMAPPMFKYPRHLYLGEMVD